LIPKSIATATLLAYIAVFKFANGLPLYRLSKIFGRIDVDLSRTTMAYWMIKAAQRLSPLLALLENEIRQRTADQHR
jgi:transposase